MRLDSNEHNNLFYVRGIDDKIEFVSMIKRLCIEYMEDNSE